MIITWLVRKCGYCDSVFRHARTLSLLRKISATDLPAGWGLPSNYPMSRYLKHAHRYADLPGKKIDLSPSYPLPQFIREVRTLHEQHGNLFFSYQRGPGIVDVPELRFHSLPNFDFAVLRDMFEWTPETEQIVEEYRIKLVGRQPYDVLHFRMGDVEMFKRVGLRTNHKAPDRTRIQEALDKVRQYYTDETIIISDSDILKAQIRLAMPDARLSDVPSIHSGVQKSADTDMLPVIKDMNLVKHCRFARTVTAHQDAVGFAMNIAAVFGIPHQSERL